MNKSIIVLFIVLLSTRLVWGGDESVIFAWDKSNDGVTKGYEVLAKDETGKIVATGKIPQTEKPAISLKLGQGTFKLFVRSVSDQMYSEWSTIEYKKHEKEKLNR